MMAIHDRLMCPADLDHALDLWVEAFCLDRTLLQAEFTLRDPHCFEHTRIAVAPDGTMLATITYSLREVRDAAGRPRLVGAVANVATCRGARRQGHARRLLAATTAAMRHAGCDWALLFTTAEGQPLYQSAGWRTVPRPYCRGKLTPLNSVLPVEYAIRLFTPHDVSGGWAVLAAIYASYNATRPLTVVRDLPYWQGYAALRFAASQAGEQAVVLVATQPVGGMATCGYVLAYAPSHRASDSAGNGTFSIAELGVLPNHKAAIPALLAAAAGAVGQPGGTGRIYLPGEPAVDMALGHLFGRTLARAEDHKRMALPLVPGCDYRSLTALASEPGAIYWPLDEV